MHSSQRRRATPATLRSASVNTETGARFNTGQVTRTTEHPSKIWTTLRRSYQIASWVRELRLRPLMKHCFPKPISISGEKISGKLARKVRLTFGKFFNKLVSPIMNKPPQSSRQQKLSPMTELWCWFTTQLAGVTRFPLLLSMTLLILARISTWRSWKKRKNQRNFGTTLSYLGVFSTEKRK